MFFGAAAADGIGVIAVGSIDNTETPVFSEQFSYTINGTAGDLFRFNPADIGMPNVTLQLYATSLDISVASDACSELPDSTPDLSKYFVLVRRGGVGKPMKVGKKALLMIDSVLLLKRPITLQLRGRSI